MDIYEEMVKLGVELHHHESDLYVPVTPETTKLVEQYQQPPFRGIVMRFTSQIDGKPWYDLPFQYQPFWDNVTAKEIAQ